MTSTTRTSAPRSPEEEIAHARRERIESTWPELTFFYGIDPLVLASMPRWLVEAYARRRPELEAREQLRLIEASGFPYMGDAARSQRYRELQMQANAGRGHGDGEVAATFEEARDRLESLGIGVTVVSPDE